MKKTNPFSRFKKSTIVRLMQTLYWCCGLGLNILAWVAPQQAGQGAYILFGWTHRLPRNQRERSWARKATRHEIRRDGQELAIFSWGEGPTVLLVHGWNGRGTQLSHFIQPLLDRGYRVVTFDAQGHGDSAGRHTNLFKFGKGVQLVAEKFGPLHGIITHSMGGAATTLALAAGVETVRLVYISPPTEPRQWAESFSRAIGFSRRTKRAFLGYLNENFREGWRQVNTLELERQRTTDLLLFHDVEDKETSWEGSQEIARAWPGARLALTKGLGHNRILKDEALISQVIHYIHQPKVFIPQTISLKKGENHETPYPYVLEQNRQIDRAGLPAGVLAG